MNNPELARIFNNMADILEILDDNPFRIRSYRKAALTLETLPHEIREMDESQWREIPGIGEGMASKIKEYLAKGKISFYEELTRKIPPQLLDMVHIPGVGPKTVKRLWDELGIKTMEGLEKAARDKKLEKLKGMGTKIEEKILKGIELNRKYKERRGIGKVLPLANAVVELLKQKAPVEQIEIAGSLRRRRETAADIDILAASKHSEKVIEIFAKLPMVSEVSSKGETKATVLLSDGIQCDLRVVEEKSFGAALHYFTGSKAHNIKIRQLAQDRGLKVNEYGIFKGEKQLGGRTEEEVFKAVGLPFIPPEIREDRGEIEAAYAGKLPKLIELKEIRGDCHMHTDWSDGSQSLSTMAHEASKRYAYAAITDHSRLVGITGGMDEKTLLKQIKEIRELAKTFKDFKLLCGIEVDIRPDGGLDMPDEALAQLDLAVACVHVKFNMTEEEMTSRIMKAMENPYITIMGHPTGRLLGSREPYPVNMDRLLDKAKQTGTFMELDSFWDRLDLNDVHLRMAKEKGVKIVISTDAHHSQHFEMLKFGVANARRGWIEPSDVVNTLSPEKFLEAIRSKRLKGKAKIHS